MMRLGIIALAAVAAVASGPVLAAAEARPEAPKFGQVSKGLRIALSPDRRVLCPGEFLHLRGYFWNVGTAPLSLPSEPAWPVGELHLKTPGGGVFTFGRLADRKWPKDNFHAVRPGEIDWLRQMHLRMTKQPQGWKPKADDKPASLSLRQDGTYSIWFVYDVPVLKGAGKDGWSGKAVSNVLTFTVRAMPPEKRRQAPTAQQQADLNTYVRGKDLDKRRQAYGRLKPALLLTENEGLALAALAELRKHPPRKSARCPAWWHNLFYCLTLRTGDPMDWRIGGIDGPAAKALAEFVMASFEKPDAELSVAYWVGQWAVSPVVACVKLHPEDKKLRSRLAALAKASARVVADRPGAATRPRPETRPAGPAPRIGLEAAWDVLLALGVLRDGMTPQQAAAILGKPTDQRGKHVGWYHSTPRRVNPYLVAELAEGKLVKWKVSSR